MLDLRIQYFPVFSAYFSFLKKLSQAPSLAGK
jgi:hypothetical protein